MKLAGKEALIAGDNCGIGLATARLSSRRWSSSWASAISKQSPDESFRGSGLPLARLT